ncbi:MULTISPECIES: hypothetical protein [unclassified Frankia]|uniref:hypothetical protein n=1 Tax=unclassified Frankia TaxID=2632575 RepID=UPI001EF6F58E|nr:MULTISPECIES: hypothetical protein [unclassified Frankia]
MIGSTGTAAGGDGPAAPSPVGSGSDQNQRAGHRRDTNDPGLRALVGAGRSRLPPGTAMRARDVARPGLDDLAEAERTLVIRRRSWTGPATAPPAQRRQ